MTLESACIIDEVLRQIIAAHEPPNPPLYTDGATRRR
jgi:hypothetical protein